MSLPAGFAWHQSGVKEYLTCPRKFYLHHVAKAEPDHGSSGFAAPVGTACHEGIAQVLQADSPVAQHEILDTMMDALSDALVKDQERGRHHDHETVQAAMAKLERKAELVHQLQADPRVAGVQWIAVEAPWSWRDGYGRLYQGTIDAYGRARRDLEDFGGEGVHVYRNEPVTVDWKTGEDHPVGRTALALNVQMPFYAQALRKVGEDPGRLFIGLLKDLEPSGRPKDEAGEPIPKWLEGLNPAYAQALGLTPEEAEASRKRPKDAGGQQIPKRLKSINPEWEEARSKPRGPLFHEVVPQQELVSDLVRSAIRGAEEGRFPATGALNSACRWCAFRNDCLEEGK